MSLLERIEKENDIKNLRTSEMPALAEVYYK